MGLYWNNFIYYGVFISRDQYESLIARNEKDIDMYSRRCCDKYLLHIPSTYYNFKNIDRMFEPHEIANGFVDITEVKECLRNRSVNGIQINNIFNPALKETVRLNEIINSLGDNTISAKLQMAQIFLCTLEPSLNDDILEHILEIKSLTSTSAPNNL